MINSLNKAKYKMLSVKLNKRILKVFEKGTNLPEVTTELSSHFINSPLNKISSADMCPSNILIDELNIKKKYAEIKKREIKLLK